MLPQALNDLTFVERFYPLAEVDSTNRYAKGIKGEPSRGLFIIQADRQTSGRGRRDNVFFSDHSGGLWVSIMAPVKDLLNHFEHNRAIALSICETLKENFPADNVTIKWPNDIYWKDRKIAGILLETIPSKQTCLIIGFGVNINIAHDEFPYNLQETATSVFIETGIHSSLSSLLVQILKKYNQYISLDQAHVHKKYLAYLYNLGYLAMVDGTEGVFRGVESDGRIVLDTIDGLKYLCSGTLRFKRGPDEKR